MKQKTKPSIAIAIGTTFFLTGSIHAQRYMENLDRGLIAINKGGESVYIGWRMLGTDPDDIAFNLYWSTDGETAYRVNRLPITNKTNFPCWL